MPKLFGQGHKYIQIDVDIHDNDKIEILRDQYEDAGFAFYVLFCCRVFENAFYVELTDRFVNKFCKRILRKTPEQFYEMLEFSITINLFDRNCFTKYKVVTSRGIQRRYLFMARKWERIKLIKEYMLDEVDYHDSTYVLYDRQGNYLGYKKKQGEFTQEEFQKRLHIKTTESSQLPEKKPSVIRPSKEFDIPIESDLIQDHLTEAHYREPNLEKEVEEFFHYNEQTNFKQVVLFGHFQTALKNSNQLSWFKSQWDAYKLYKKETGYPHKFKNFIGKQETLFMDGAWNEENWDEKLKEHKKGLKNGNHAQPTKTGHKIDHSAAAKNF